MQSDICQMTRERTRRSLGSREIRCRYGNKPKRYRRNIFVDTGINNRDGGGNAWDRRMCPTKTPAEVRPVQIAEDPFLSTKDITVFRYQMISSFSWQVHDDGTNLQPRCRRRRRLTADVDADLVGDTEREYSTAGVVACSARAPVD